MDPMTSRVRRAALAAATLLTVSAVSSCSSDNPTASPAPATSSAAQPSASPAVCSSLDALKSSVADLEDVKVGDDGLSRLGSLAAVKEDLQQVMSDAKEQFKPEISAVTSSVDDLQTSLKAAQSDSNTWPCYVAASATTYCYRECRPAAPRPVA